MILSLDEHTATHKKSKRKVTNVLQNKPPNYSISKKNKGRDTQNYTTLFIFYTFNFP